MKKIILSIFISSLSFAGGFDSQRTSTQTITGQSVFVSTRAVIIQPNGNVGVAIGSTLNSTDGASVFDVSLSTGPGLAVFNNAGQTVGSANSMMTLVSTNTTYGGYFLRILRNDSNSNGEIRVDSPAPNFEFVETDQTNAKFEIGINNGVSYWATRNAANDSFERVLNVRGPISGAQGISVLSTGTVTFEDTVGSGIGFKAPNTLGASWSHDLWSTTDNTGKVLTQSTSGAPRALFFTNVIGKAGADIQFSSNVVLGGGNTTFYYSAPAVIASVEHSTLTIRGGHVVTAGSSPSLSSCGSSPSVVGTDTAFTITGGTGSTGCTATFALSYQNAPVCQVSQQAMSLINALSYTVSASAVTITQTGLGTSKLDVFCIGR